MNKEVQYSLINDKVRANIRLILHLWNDQDFKNHGGRKQILRRIGMEEIVFEANRLINALKNQTQALDCDLNREITDWQRLIFGKEIYEEDKSV